MHQFEPIITEAFRDRSRLEDAAVRNAVEQTIDLLDRGEVRVASRTPEGWTTHSWVKEAILLYFAMRPLEPIHAGGLEFFDKIPVKQRLQEQGVRVVPPGIARYGAFLEPGCILMPGYVNIGAYVGSGDDGGYLGNGRLVRTDRRGRASVGGGWGSGECWSRRRLSR